MSLIYSEKNSISINLIVKLTYSLLRKEAIDQKNA